MTATVQIKPASNRFNSKDILTYLIIGAVACLALGVFTSVALCAGYHVLLLVPGSACLACSFRRNGWKALSASSWALLALIGIGVISCLINWDSMQSPLRGLFKLKYFAFGILGLMALRHVISRGVSKKVVRGLLHLFFASIIVSVIYGLTATFADFDLVTWQKGQFDRVGGLTRTMRFGYGMGMVLPVLLTLWLRRREWADWFDARLLTLALAMGLAGLMLTQTRGALLGLLCAVPLVLYFYRPKAGYLVGGVCGLAIVLLAVGNYLGEERIAILLPGKTQGSSAGMLRGFESMNVRLSQYKAALYGIQERPVFGFGMRGYPQHVPRIKRQHGLKEDPSDTTHAHNTFLEIGANLGISGLAAFLAWLFLWGWESRQRHDAVAVCVPPFLLAFVVSGQFTYLFDANNAFLIFLLYALSSSITGLSKTDQEKEDDCFQPIKYVEVRAEKTTAPPGFEGNFIKLEE